jgi:hypothetical protein
MSFGQKGVATRKRGVERPVNARQVIGTPASSPKSNRKFGSGLFYAAALLIGGGGWWAHNSMMMYYEDGIPVVAEVTGSREVTPNSSARRYTKYSLRAQHPKFGPVELELRKPSDPAPLPGGQAATDERVLVLLHPDDPAAGRIASASGPTTPIAITSVMAFVLALVAALNLFSERRIIGSRKTRLRRD